MDNAEAVQRIAAAITPAVMVSACGLLALGLDNQAARMTSRLRDLALEFRSIHGQGDRERTLAIRRETTILARRHRHYTVALLCNYGALLAFVLTSVSALSGALGASHLLTLSLFTLGVVLLAVMAIYTIIAVRLSRRAISIEEEYVLRSSAESLWP